MDRRDKGRKSGPDYFGEALADFTHDMASGGAIRHMVNLGCPADEIRRRLDFPTSLERVQKTVFDYMIKSGMLLRELPAGEGSLRTAEIAPGDGTRLCGRIRERIRENGEAQSYLACDYGRILRGSDAISERTDPPGELCRGQGASSAVHPLFSKRTNLPGEESADTERYRIASGYRAGERRTRLEASLACLTGRERDYLLGIPWEPRRMYHVLNSRMAEIGLQLALAGEEQVFCFLRTGERLVVKGERRGGMAP